MSVDVTANHKGYFIFRLCVNNDPRRPAPESCFNQHVLKMMDGTEKFYIGSGTGTHSTMLKLPQTVSCSNCVLQWQYVAGNNWGFCSDGTGAVGCGPQEEFRACADISIGSGNSVLTTTTSTTRRPVVVTKPWWPWLWSWTRKRTDQPRKSISYFLSSLAKKNVMLKLDKVSSLNETALTDLQTTNMDLTTVFEYLHKLAAKILYERVYNFFTNLFS